MQHPRAIYGSNVDKSWVKLAAEGMRMSLAHAASKTTRTKQMPMAVSLLVHAESKTTNMTKQMPMAGVGRETTVRTTC